MIEQLTALPTLWRAATIAGVSGLRGRVRFAQQAIACPAEFKLLMGPPAGHPLQRLCTERPRATTFMVAPYMDARWNTVERVRALASHARTHTGALARYAFGIGEELAVLDLTPFDIPEYRIVIDKPEWFLREGLLTINLFRQDLRVFSISYSLQHGEAGLDLFIGGVQGRKIDGILDLYRDFTKLTHGMRPRDFLIEILRMVARADGVTRILGIPDEYRHQRHPYFSRDTGRELPLDYNEIWIDRGGELLANGWYGIPLFVQREFETIPARKRSLYRKRFDLQERLDTAIGESLKTVQPRPTSCVDETPPE